MTNASDLTDRPVVELGLRQNLRQFSLLVVVTAFVGSMVGLERSVIPLLAEGGFGVASKTAILSFIATFGFAKAISNLFAGRGSDIVGRKRILVAGWILGLPVPFLIWFAPTWSWIVAANLLLGVNQGLTWSSTVIMKIDLVGPRKRGFAMGLNEAAGYAAVGLMAFLSGVAASTLGIREATLVLGSVCAVGGLILSVVFVRDTKAFALLEATRQISTKGDSDVSFGHILLLTSWKNRTLFSVSQAGMFNNMNDGLAWGLLPILFSARGFSLLQIGLLAGIYPAVWGLGQLATGAWSDRIGRKPLIVGGMLLQAGGIASLLVFQNFEMLIVSLATMGAGTACVYPTLLAAVSDVAHPSWRATSVGVYRLWRDGGYVLGAIAVGILADVWDIDSAIGAVAALTALSGLVAAVMMKETLPKQQSGTSTQL